jgi:hypothetical protein
MASIGGASTNVLIGEFKNGTVDSWSSYRPCVELKKELVDAARLAFGSQDLVALPERNTFVVAGVKEAAKWGLFYIVLYAGTALITEGTLPPINLAFFGLAARQVVDFTEKNTRLALAVIANYGEKLKPLVDQGLGVNGKAIAENTLTVIQKTLTFAANHPKETLMVGAAVDGVVNQFRVTGHVAGTLVQGGLQVFDTVTAPVRDAMQVGGIVALLLTGVVIYNLPSKSQKQLEFKTSQAERVAIGFGVLASLYLVSRKRKSSE